MAVEKAKVGLKTISIGMAVVKLKNGAIVAIEGTTDVYGNGNTSLFADML